MDSYQEDIRELRKEFQKVNPNDPNSLRTWFEQTPYLNTSDRCHITGVSQYTITKWKRKAGIPPANITPPKTIKLVTPPTIPVPDNWDTPEWLTHAYYITRSVRQIAKAVGVDHRKILNRFKRYGIEVNYDYKRLHHCRNRKWLQQHYIKEKLTALECAKLAGVTRDTITNWLIEFKIPVRSRTETDASRRRDKPPHVTLWGRKLYHQLKKLPEVTRVRVRDRGIIVNYRTCIKEVYWFGDAETRRHAYSIKREDTRLDHIPKVYEQYPEKFGDSQHPAHVMIQRADWLASSIMERRIALHRLHLELRRRRWQRPTVPKQVLTADFARIQGYRRGRHIRKGGFIAFTGRTAHPGWNLMLHYFDVGAEFNPIWGSPYKLYKAMQRVAKTNRGLTTVQIARTAACIYGPRLGPPTMWADVFSQLGIRGTVLDLYPGLGSRAMACAVNGLRYMTPPDERFDGAMRLGFGDEIGLDWVGDDGSVVDLVVADDSFRGVDVGKALRSSGRARQIMVFVPHDGLKAASVFNPRIVLRLRSRLYSNKSDYLLIW